MRSVLRSILPLATLLGVALAPDSALAQCPDFDGDGTPDGTDCSSGGPVPVSPPAPIEPAEERAPPEPEPSPSNGGAAPEPPLDSGAPSDGAPALPEAAPSGATPSGATPSGAGGYREDPAVTAQRAIEQAAARAAWERAAQNLRALEERGRTLAAERLAFRRLLDAAGSASRRAAQNLVRVPVRVAPPATTRPWQGAPPTARGRRLAGPPPPPLGAERFVPSSSPWPEPPPIAGLFDPREALLSARDEVLERTEEWLTGQAQEVIERNVPGVRRLRELYETLERYARIGQDLSRDNEATVDGVFRGAGEVTRCMAGRPCDAAFVDSLVHERVDAHGSTARDWIRDLTGEGDEGDDDDEEEGDSP